MADIDSARREAIRILCLAQASDQLSVDAFETRLEQVRHAPNAATLAAILADLDQAALPVPLTTTSSLEAIGPRTDEMAPVSPAEFLRLASVFGSTARAGSWTVPLAIEARVLLGEMTIDLRDAVFGSDVVDIEIDVALGSFTLIVPAGTQVENEVTETLSSSTHSVRSARGARPNGLLVRLQGKALLASVEVKERFPSGQGKPKSMLQRLLGGD
ncbi:MAG: hypothetical protein SFV24_16335 [Gemmatimonadales bacterium]|nr:hypothetical protein [Gemmatimonadales bacterium]